MEIIDVRERCKVCNGSRGLVIARVTVVRRSPYGEWKYVRFTHRVRLFNGRFKRKYCYDPLKPK